MLKLSGDTVQAWREAMGEWRETGDITALAQTVAQMDPSWRLLFLDSILPASLRNDLKSVLPRRAGRHPHSTRQAA